jgi:hypothetical protein
MDDLQHYGVRADLAVLLSRHCDSETSKPFAGLAIRS